MGFCRGKAIGLLTYGRSKFQNEKFTNLIADFTNLIADFTNLIADLNSSQKSINVMCFPFLGSAPEGVDDL